MANNIRYCDMRTFYALLHTGEIDFRSSMAVHDVPTNICSASGSMPIAQPDGSTHAGFAISPK